MSILLMLILIKNIVWNIFVLYFKSNAFLWCKAEFTTAIIPVSVSHDPLEIIQICFFFCIVYALFFWVNRTCKMNSIYLHIYFFLNDSCTVTFAQCNVFLLNQSIHFFWIGVYILQPYDILKNSIALASPWWPKHMIWHSAMPKNSFNNGQNSH